VVRLGRAEAFRDEGPETCSETPSCFSAGARPSPASAGTAHVSMLSLSGPMAWQDRLCSCLRRVGPGVDGSPAKLTPRTGKLRRHRIARAGPPPLGTFG